MSNIPKIRFNFEKDWQAKSLSSVCNDIKTGKLDANAATKSGKYKFFTCSREDYKTNTYAFDGDSVVINGNGDLGITKVFSGKFNAYQRNYVLMDFTEDYKFIGHSIPRYLPSKIKKEAIGGAMPYIKIETLNELMLGIPEIPEQKQIASFLSNVDFLIENKKKELEKMKQYKATMLYKMFPQYGKLVPEIRFKDFEGEWQNSKFNIGQISKGLGFSKNDLSKKGKPLFLYGRMYTKFQIFVKEIDTFTQNKNAARILSNGNEVVIPASGETAEDISRATAILSKGIILGGDLNIIKISKEFDSIFISMLITYSRFHYELGKKAQGKTIVHIRGADIASIIFLYPTLEEQQKIAEFLSSLDLMITNQEKEIEILEHMKATLLSKMFA